MPTSPLARTKATLSSDPLQTNYCLDFHLIALLDVVKSDTGALFGVFDGHSGDKCSAFAARHLPAYGELHLSET